MAASSCWLRPSGNRVGHHRSERSDSTLDVEELLLRGCPAGLQCHLVGDREDREHRRVVDRTRRLHDVVEAELSGVVGLILVTSGQQRADSDHGDDRKQSARSKNIASTEVTEYTTPAAAADSTRRRRLTPADEISETLTSDTAGGPFSKRRLARRLASVCALRRPLASTDSGDLRSARRAEHIARSGR
jgi:hypothetical protein